MVIQEANHMPFNSETILLITEELKIWVNPVVLSVSTLDFTALIRIVFLYFIRPLFKNALEYVPQTMCIVQAP